MLSHPLFAYLKRNQQLAVFVGVVVTSMMLLYAFIGYTPKYQADAKVLVRDSALTAKYLNDEQITTTSSALTNPILNNLNLLKTADISEALYNYLKQNNPKFLESKNIKSMADWDEFFNDGSAYIKAKNVPGTDIIAITFAWNDPATAKKGLDAILVAFQHASLKINQSEQLEKADYLQGQADTIRLKLSDLRTRIAVYKKANGTVDIAREMENYSKSRVDFDSNMKMAMAEAQAKHSEMNRYQSVIGMSASDALRGTALGSDPTTAKLYDQLYTLREQQAQYKLRFTDKHPTMRQLNSQIAQLEKDIHNQQSRSLGGRAVSKKQVIIGDATRANAVVNFVQAQGQASGLSVRAGLMNKYLHEIEGKMAKLPEIEANLSKFRDEEGVLSASLAVMQQKAMEARIRSAQSLSNIYIVDKPLTPRNASFPTQTHIIVLAFVLGFVSAISVVLLKLKLEEALGREILVPVPSFGGVVASVSVGRNQQASQRSTTALPRLNPYQQH